MSVDALAAALAGLDPAAAIDLRHRFFADSTWSPPDPLPPRITAGPWSGPEIPEIDPGDLDADRYRTLMADHGCVLVRGLIDEARAAELRRHIDRAIEAFDSDPDAMPDRAEWFTPFSPRPEHGKLGIRRKFMRDAGSLWAVDSPRMFDEVLALYQRIGVLELVETILGERPVISANKYNLRRVPTGIPTNWHQDGAFLGQETRSVNLWLSLSHCGVDAPGLDLVPRRIDHVVDTGTHDAVFDWSVAQAVVDEVAGDAGVVRPVFAPGDALLFDHLFLHRTALSEAMTHERYAIESWFFSPSTFPEGQIPIVV
ncbi:MAG: phytanoyl-CoA dioxygenase family protein [Acidimicrobiales bacterium]